MSDESQLREDALRLSCRELVDLVTDYDDDALDRQRRREFEAHLALCVGCKNHVGQMHESARLAGRLGRQEITEETRERLLALYRAWKQERA